MQTIISYRLDACLFIALTVGITTAIHFWLRRREVRGLPRLAWVATLAIGSLGLVAANYTGASARHRLRDRLEGIAPTYAQEIELLGHAALTTQTPTDDPDYLKMIAAEMRWQKVNPNVSDIYTYRKDADGNLFIIVDSETDYDHNGEFEGEREERTTIGEAYDQPTPSLVKALDGVAGFDEEAETDRWGTWVSAYVPLHRADGSVEGALGVDYDASKWTMSIAWSRVGALGFVGLLYAAVVSATTIVAITRSEMAKRAGLQRRLVDASRQAGMAEVATGILHNVGNVLNSVNVSADVLTTKVRDSKVAGFSRAAALIRENRSDLAGFIANDAKGKVLPDYLMKLSDLLAGEQESMLSELSQLGRSLTHIKQIVASQQTFAKDVEIVETFEAGDMIDDALRMSVEKLRQPGLKVHRTATACPPITADRHKVLQIMVNLIGNAAQVVAQSPQKNVVVAVEVVAGNGDEPLVRLKVTDTGHGITAENLPKLFTHGFTTRTEGHGFGLHFAAIAAHNMHGQLTAASEGEGHGATFILEIPINAKKKEGAVCQSA